MIPKQAEPFFRCPTGQDGCDTLFDLASFRVGRVLLIDQLLTPKLPATLAQNFFSNAPTAIQRPSLPT